MAADGYDDWFTSYDTGLKGGTTTDLSIALAREGLGARSERRLPAPEIVFPTDGENSSVFLGLQSSNGRLFPVPSRIVSRSKGVKVIERKKGASTVSP